MERRRMRGKPSFGKRMMVTILSLVMLLSVFSPGLMVGAEETVEQQPTQETTSFLDNFMEAYDQQTLSGGAMNSQALTYVARLNGLKDKVAALDAASETYESDRQTLLEEAAGIYAEASEASQNGGISESEWNEVTAAYQVVGGVVQAQSGAAANAVNGAALVKKTVNAYVDEKNFAVTGNLPEGTTLSVTKLESEVNDYIHNNILGLDALPAGYTGEAFDIKLLDKDGNAFQPAEQVNVGITADGITENSDITVYHLPDTSADDVYAGYNREINGISLMRTIRELIGEKIETVNVYEGYYAFLTEGFSTYYVVAGSKSDNSGDDTFNILRGVSVQLTGVSSDNYTVTYPDGVTAENSGVNISRSGNTLTFAATSSAALGTYSIKISSYRTATINVLSPADMFALDGIENDVYFTVVPNSTEIPNEPMAGGHYDWNYIRKSGSNYTFNQYALGTFGRYQDSPDGFLKLDVIGASPALKQNLQGQNVVGVIDRGWGADTRPCVNLTDAEWHNILVQFVSNKIVYISNGAGGQTRLTSTMVNETLKDGSYRYKMYPYVVKLIIDGGDNQDGWHVDCAIVDTKIYSVSYDYNLPSSAIIQETDDLLKPETKFYTPGTTGVEVGVMKLGTRTEVTGDTSITIYDTNTLTTSEYKFLYWNTEPDGSGTSRDPDDVLPDINENVTLYAIWNHTQTSGTVKIQKNAIFEDPNDARKDDVITYSFTVTITNAEEGKTYPYAIYDASGYVISAEDAEIASGGTFSLKNGESIEIHNVPGGDVTVSETVADGAAYTPSWVVENNESFGNSVTGTVSAGNQAQIVCRNTYAPLESQVTVSKTVTGNMGDQAKEFSFTASVSIASMNGMTYKYSDSDTVNTISGSTCTFTLKHGQSVVFDKVPIGSTLTVVENLETDSAYTAYYKDHDDEDETLGNEASVVVLSNGTASIAFRNDHQVTIDTGIELNSYPFFLMLSFVIVSAGFFILGKKRMMF